MEDVNFNISIPLESGGFVIHFEGFSSQPLSAENLVKVITAWGLRLKSVPGSDRTAVLRRAIANKAPPKVLAKESLSIEDLGL